MNLAGRTLGSYEVKTLIGSGGMGHVYRAWDTRLKRDVAIKVLPDAFSRDAERVARFQREAEVLASLNHPHIAAIYDLQNFEEGQFLVLELVAGETLEERIARGAVPIEDALPIATQIADALEAAHEQGIIHRDLKPANIKITPNGTVKVLDLGLAKVSEPAGADSSNSPTKVTAATPNSIMGTAAYMSPEQAKGKNADRRSDVWAFGCVLFEMLAGRSAFQGETLSEVLADVLKAEPDWNGLPEDTPEAVRRLLARCLQKDVGRRLRDIGDARIEIEDALTRPVARNCEMSARKRSSSSWLAAVGAGIVIGAAFVLTAIYFRAAPNNAPKMRLEIAAPGRSSLAMAISPDSRAMVFDLNEQGRSKLWIRPLDSAAGRPLPGTEDAFFPFWSPDSRSLAFFANGKLKRIEVAGGPAQVLADTPNARGGAWNSDGTILFSATSGGTLSRISLDGRNLGAATQLQADQGSHRYPQFLPDGKHFIYFALGKPDVSGVYLGTVGSVESKRILASDSQAVYASPGYLLFLRQGVLLAQPFDLKKLELTGDPTPQAEHVAMTFTGFMVGSAADNGTFAYRTSAGNDARLTWLDRSGKEMGAFGPVGNWDSVDLSKDETRVVTHKSDNGNVDIWMVEVTRGTATRLTSNPADDEWPVWSPDGSQIAFDSNRKGPFDLYQLAIRDIGKEAALVESSHTKGADSWSSDGLYLLFANQEEGGRSRLWVRPFSGEATPVPVTRRNFDQVSGSFSPDNRWIAYESNESSRSEVYVQAFPDSGEKWQISLDGGGDPRWRSDGKEIFYISLNGTLMAATVSVVDGGKQIRAGKPAPLFQTTLGVGRGKAHGYAVANNGQRFLLAIPVEKTPPPITILLNWAGH